MTEVPNKLQRLTEQRRRWNNSTLENTLKVVCISKLWNRAPFYMLALALDTGGFYLSPALFLTLFGNSLGAFVNNSGLIIALYAGIFLWILLTMLAGLSLFPKESAPLFKTCVLFGAFLMAIVGLIAIFQMSITIRDQLPLISGLVVYSGIIFTTAFRHDGWKGIVLVVIGGSFYVLLLPTFYILFLLYSVTRYDTTSWR